MVGCLDEQVIPRDFLLTRSARSTLSCDLSLEFSLVWGSSGWAFSYIFQMQTLNQELDNFNYEKVIEQIKDKNPDYPG